MNDATELAAGRPSGAVLNKAKKEENQTIDHHHYGRKLNGLPLCSFISPISSQRLHYLLMLAMQADLQQKMTCLVGKTDFNERFGLEHVGFITSFKSNVRFLEGFHGISSKIPTTSSEFSLPQSLLFFV